MFYLVFETWFWQWLYGYFSAHVQKLKFLLVYMSRIHLKYLTSSTLGLVIFWPMIIINVFVNAQKNCIDLKFVQNIWHVLFLWNIKFRPRLYAYFSAHIWKIWIFLANIQNWSKTCNKFCRLPLVNVPRFGRSHFWDMGQRRI